MNFCQFLAGHSSRLDAQFRALFPESKNKRRGWRRHYFPAVPLLRAFLTPDGWYLLRSGFVFRDLMLVEANKSAPGSFGEFLDHLSRRHWRSHPEDRRTQ